MESISIFNNLSQMVLILINAGAVIRILLCVINIMTGDIQKGQQMKDRIIHILIFLAIANSLFILNNIAQNYWG